MGLTDTVVAELDAARRRSLMLLEPLDEPALVRQHSPLMSPLVWDLAHVGNYEDQWLLRAVGAPGARPDLDGVYDAFRHPRPNRPALPLLSPVEARAYLADVRTRALDALHGAGLDALDARRRDDLDPARPRGARGGPAPDGGLLDGGFVYAMVVQHEHQHVETMLATLQLASLPLTTTPPTTVLGTRRAPGAAVPAAGGAGRGDEGPAADDVLVEGGTCIIGTSADRWAYDNEGPAHEVDLASFRIDTTPVTNRAYAEFVDDGGYHARRWWTDQGWDHRRTAGLEHPQFWRRDGPTWARERFGVVEPLPLDEPVQHVCWYEADAYARWAGRRLPTEPEWEKAASWDPATGRQRRYPWGDTPPGPGRANLGGDSFGPAPAAVRRGGASAYGCHQLLGDVWEWTSSDFAPYPGFSSFPYREYSEVFFGADHKVLRGGSWATHPSAVRATFRNWDLPVRRQIFAGFRTAIDAR